METPLLFHLPPVLSPAMRHALDKPQCLPILATAVLVRLASRAMRADGSAAGPAVVIDAIPAFAMLGVDHRARKPFQGLAGLIEDGGFHAIRGELIDGRKVPSLALIGREAMNRKGEFARALRAAADAVEGFQGLPAYE
jgi:hypothetical protein